MLPINNSIRYLVGNSNMEFNCEPLIPFDDIVCDFLSNLSIELLSDSQAKRYSDIVSFAFWCRKSNIERLKNKYTNKTVRIGRGIAFHITPSNVPINFAFSFVFSLLAGNGNIVRVPSKEFPQINIVCGAINKIFKNAKFNKISKMCALIKYDHNDEITSQLSGKCDARIIWGGNNTINTIRKNPIPERSVEIAFADRYSFCVINSESINNMEESQIKRLSDDFYNDTYLMDQNACSSPQLVVWLGDRESVEKAKAIFWNNIYKTVTQKYELQPVYAIDKYTQFCENAIDLNYVSDSHRYGNYIYCLDFNSLPYNVDELRGKCGYFYEYETNNLNTIAKVVNNKYQTLTYFGLSKSELVDFVLSNSLTGIDRIVPVGSALDISIVWDGYDLINTLSRIINIK